MRMRRVSVFGSLFREHCSVLLQWCLSPIPVHFRDSAMICALAESQAPEQCTKYFLLHYFLPFFYLVQTSKHKQSNLVLDTETRECTDLYKHMRRKVELKKQEEN